MGAACVLTFARHPPRNGRVLEIRPKRPSVAELVAKLGERDTRRMSSSAEGPAQGAQNQVSEHRLVIDNFHVTVDGKLYTPMHCSNVYFRPVEHQNKTILSQCCCTKWKCPAPGSK